MKTQTNKNKSKHLQNTNTHTHTHNQRPGPGAPARGQPFFILCDNILYNFGLLLIFHALICCPKWELSTPDSITWETIFPSHLNLEIQNDIFQFPRPPTHPISTYFFLESNACGVWGTAKYRRVSPGLHGR